MYVWCASHTNMHSSLSILKKSQISCKVHCCKEIKNQKKKMTELNEKQWSPPRVIEYSCTSADTAVVAVVLLLQHFCLQILCFPLSLKLFNDFHPHFPAWFLLRSLRCYCCTLFLLYSASGVLKWVFC